MENGRRASSPLTNNSRMISLRPCRSVAATMLLTLLVSGGSTCLSGANALLQPYWDYLCSRLGIFFFNTAPDNTSGLTIYTTGWMALNYLGLIVWVFVWMIDQARMRGKNFWVWLVPFVLAPLPTLMLFVLFLQRRIRRHRSSEPVAGMRIVTQLLDATVVRRPTPTRYRVGRPETTRRKIVPSRPFRPTQPTDGRRTLARALPGKTATQTGLPYSDGHTAT